jgi:YesN/AraC family two-component response regulator
LTTSQTWRLSSFRSSAIGSRIGRSAAALKANGQIDLAVTDINMPRMDGLSLLQKLQENEEQVSTIIVSAYGDMANIRTAMNRGAFDFVTKPIDFHDLETTIAKTIRHIEFLRDARQRQAVAERAYASLSHRTLPSGLPATRMPSTLADSAARLRHFLLTSPVSPPLWKRWNPASSDRCSMSISRA